ncbi:MAG: hypothetical protein JWQ08_1972 [Deinococcus sp.]|nr:hypothetical protein [Deinococcus sp.]
MSFNPGLNRVTIADFANLPAGMAGTLAHEWLATWSIAPKMQAELGAVVAASGLPLLSGYSSKNSSVPARAAGFAVPHLALFLNRHGSLGGIKRYFRQKAMRTQGQKVDTWKAYPLALNDALREGNEEAAAFAERMGIALAAVLATLAVAPAQSRAARPEWPAAHWEQWRGVRNIVLGGGVLEGLLGQHIYATACRWLPELGASQLRLHLFPQPRSLMLHGAARQYQEGSVLVLDAGHTALKRAVVEVGGGEVLRLELAPPLPTPYGVRDGRALLEVLTEALVNPLIAGQRVSQVAVSLSVHLDQSGRVAQASADSSFYDLLAGFPLTDALQDSLTVCLGYPCSLKAMHEGQAAVCGLATMDAAVLLGTSVGGALKA